MWRDPWQPESVDENRRPLKLRSAAVIQWLARVAQRMGLKPNTVSLASIGFSALAGLALVLSAFFESRSIAAVLLLMAPVLIGLRGLCNVLDGLIAVEGGMKSRSGEVFNDLPDRVSDLLMFGAAGYAVRGMPYAAELGWMCAALAIMTAYVRVLGAATGAGHDFEGPMAKTHRMAVLAAACVVASLEVWLSGRTLTLALGLFFIAAGCVCTIVRRCVALIQRLEQA
jgi:phosphatidylglycerophosphate synthase